LLNIIKIIFKPLINLAMKKLICFISFVAFFAASFSQDIIVKNDKSEIKANVLGVQGDFVRYTLFESSDGQIKNIPVADVFVILYKNGTRETFDFPLKSPDIPLKQTETAQSSPVQQNEIVFEEPREGFFIGGKGNYYIPWNSAIKEIFGSGFMIGGVLGYEGLKSGMELDLRYLSMKSDFDGEDVKFSLFPITVTGYWNFYKGTMISTYVGGGVGVCFINLADESETLNSTGFEIHSTGGIRFKPFYFEVTFSTITSEDYNDADLGGIILGFGFFF